MTVLIYLLPAGAYFFISAKFIVRAEYRQKPRRAPPKKMTEGYQDGEKVSKVNEAYRERDSTSA